MKEVIVLDDVSRIYRMGDEIVYALNHVSLCIYDGSFTSIMGPSGSGKSTIMSIIGCLDVPTYGHVLIDGEDTSGMSEKDLSYIRNRTLYDSSNLY